MREEAEEDGDLQDHRQAAAERADLVFRMNSIVFLFILTASSLYFSLMAFNWG